MNECNKPSTSLAAPSSSDKVPVSEALSKSRKFEKVQSLRPSRVKSFIRSLFIREDETNLEVEKSVHHSLIQSIKDERQNYIWTFLVAVSVFTYFTYIMYHWLLRHIGIIGM